jgi:DNA invertase Pin-like site-specific DNA recombinase
MKAEAQVREQAGKQCFSYIRFSSSKQAAGDSQKRQTQIAPRIAAEKGWTLREDLNIADLGLSAYKKQNIGSLKAVQAAAESGNIPKGSVMIIEALDRLTSSLSDLAGERKIKIV